MNSSDECQALREIISNLKIQLEGYRNGFYSQEKTIDALMCELKELKQQFEAWTK